MEYKQVGLNNESVEFELKDLGKYSKNGIAIECKEGDLREEDFLFRLMLSILINGEKEASMMYDLDEELTKSLKMDFDLKVKGAE